MEDGTRFVKSRFPEEVVSLPYSTRLETAEGLQYFRVMHSHQIKTCRLCMSPEHVLKTARILSATSAKRGDILPGIVTRSSAQIAKRS